jgi:hypothetical protein
MIALPYTISICSPLLGRHPLEEELPNETRPQTITSNLQYCSHPGKEASVNLKLFVKRAVAHTTATATRK